MQNRSNIGYINVIKVAMGAAILDFNRWSRVLALNVCSYRVHALNALNGSYRVHALNARQQSYNLSHVHLCGLILIYYVLVIGIENWNRVMTVSFRYLGPDTQHSLALHGCPISIQVQQLGGCVTAWCWILVDSGRFLAKIARGYNTTTKWA